MMVAVVAALSIAIFTVSLFASGLVTAGRSALSITRQAFDAMRDESLSEEQRESHVQKASVKLAGMFVSITGRCILALALGFVPVWLFDATGVVAMEETLHYMSRWDVIVVSTILITIGVVVWHRLRKSR